MSETARAYEQLVEHLKQTALLASCASVLSWDEQTYMPPGGAELRAKQMALLAGLVHERTTDPRVGEWLSELEAGGDLGEPDGPMAVNVRETRRSYDRASKLPRRLVEEISRTTTLAQQAWVDARKEADFASFQPWLEKVVALKREEAEAIGYGDGVPYDALLDEYEPGATAEQIAAVFSPLREQLVALAGAIRQAGRQPDVSILTRRYPIDAQRQFGVAAARAIGFDFRCGRLDVAPHPFCSGFGPGDCRLTTRFDEHHFPGAFFGTLHEAGHGIYDQGLDPEAFGTPMGETALSGFISSSRLGGPFRKR